MAEDWKAEYDQRQYRLMADQLQGYEEGKLNLASLVSRLEALLSALEAPDKAWKNDFWSKWGTLETVYAVALDRNEQGLAPDAQATINDPSHRALINEAVQNLRRLVQDRIDTTAGAETDAEDGATAG